MSIFVSAPTGHVGSRVAQLLVQAGVRPTLLVRDPARLAPEIREASEVRVYDQDDAASVVEATRGARSLFWLNPPAYGDGDPIAASIRKGENAVRAVRENGIARVVFLSSAGAELRHGVGLIDGSARTEEALDATEASLVHLRPGFFFTNFLGQLDALRHGVLPAPAPADLTMPYVDPRDIGEIAAALLLNPVWSSHRRIQPIHGPKLLTFAETAEIIGKATGRSIAFEEVPDEAFRGALVQAGLSEVAAQGYLQMYVGLRNGYAPQNPDGVVATSPTPLGAWAYENLRPALG